MNASGRPNTCKSNGNREKLAFPLTSGARVRNAYRTYPVQGDSPEKFGLIPRGNDDRHRLSFKVSAVQDGYASY